MDKRTVITHLRSKISQLQLQLNHLQRSSNHSSLDRGSLSNSRRHNYGPSPITGTLYPVIKLHSPTSKLYPSTPTPKRSRKQSLSAAKRELSPKLREVTNNTSTSYYYKRTPPQSPGDNLLKEAQLNQTVHVSQRFKHSDTGKQSYKQGASPTTIRTYPKKLTNVILCPEEASPKGRKIVKRLERSSQKYYTEHPKSNPRLAIFQDWPVILEKRKAGKPSKNDSHFSLTHGFENDDDVFVTKQRLNQTAQRPKKGNKKHFAQYFKDTLDMNYE